MMAPSQLVIPDCPTKHTPGPWRLRGREIITRATATIAMLPPLDSPEGVANGRLLQAAPDMEVALLRCITQESHVLYVGDLETIARSLLARIDEINRIARDALAVARREKW